MRLHAGPRHHNSSINDTASKITTYHWSTS